jgi:inositol transporter-like SP family MFS transporter
MLGIRIVFLHLFVAALVTWALRRGLAESARWRAASSSARQNVGRLLSGPHLRAMAWTATIYLFWNLAAGTAGIFSPYFIQTLNAGSQAASTGMYSLAFVTAMLVTWVVFMPYADGSHAARKWLWGIGAAVQIVAWGMLIFLPFTAPAIVANIVMFAGGGALAGEAFYKVFSQELFPTLLRGTAQGITFGVARTLLGIWSFLVPMLAEKDIRQVAALLTLFLAISGVVGFFGMPDTSGKTLEQIEAERARA